MNCFFIYSESRMYYNDIQTILYCNMSVKFVLQSSGPTSKKN